MKENVVKRFFVTLVLFASCAILQADSTYLSLTSLQSKQGYTGFRDQVNAVPYGDEYGRDIELQYSSTFPYDASLINPSTPEEAFGLNLQDIDWCTNGTLKMKIYVPPHLTYFKVALQVLPINSALGFATFLPNGGTIDERDAKGKNELGASAYYDKLWNRGETVIFAVNETADISFYPDIIDEYNIDTSKGGYLYLSFTQADKIISSARPYDSRYNVSAVVQMDFEHPFTEAMRNEILSAVPDGESEPSEAPAHVVSKECDAPYEYDIDTESGDAGGGTENSSGSSSSSSDVNATPIPQLPEDTERNSGIAECNFYYAVNGSKDCRALAEKYDYDLVSMMAEPEVFQGCVNSNCGTYAAKAGSREERSTYIYKMETEKGCTKIDEQTVPGTAMAPTKWRKFEKRNGNGELEMTDEVINTIPFMTIHYKCPPVKETVCVRSERVMQSPVMCIKQGADQAAAMDAKDCIENKSDDACSAAHDAGGISKLIYWRYCDADLDGDGFNEALSPEAQDACNRSDASMLRCAKNAACQTTARCTKRGRIGAISSTFEKCKDLTRHFQTRTVNTQCGNMADPYLLDENCVRTNSEGDARANATAKTYSFRASGSQSLQDYTEYVVYRKRAGYAHDTILAALVMPKAFYKHTKYSEIASIRLDELFPWLGDTSRKSPYVLDDHLAQTEAMGFDMNSTQGSEYSGKKTWSKRRWNGIVDKYAKSYVGRMWWNEDYVRNNIKPALSFHGWKPYGFSYNIDVTTRPNEILAVYNVNDNRDLTFAAPTILANMAPSGSCVSDGGGNGGGWRTFMKGYGQPDGMSAHKKTVFNMGLVIPFTGLYTFKFYKDDTFLFSTSRYFGREDNTTHYPLSGENLFYDGDNAASSIVDELSSATQEGIGKAVENKLENPTSAATMDDWANDLIDAYFAINAEGFKGVADPKPLHEYSQSAPLREMVLDMKVEEWLKDNYGNDVNPCDGVPVDYNVSDGYEANSLDGFNDWRNYVKECFREHYPEIMTEVNSTVDSISGDSISHRKNAAESLANEVLDGYRKIQENLEHYLLQPADRYTVSTTLGTWQVSFRSSCGDFSNAASDAYLNYDSMVSDFSKTNFGSENAFLRDHLITLLQDFYDPVTLKYAYQETEKRVIQKWDLQSVNAQGVSYWGAIDENGSADEPMDQNTQCDGVYRYYFTPDNFADSDALSGSDKYISGINTGVFQSAGAYTCDEISLTATGASDSLCQTASKHDLYLADSNITVTDRQWSSTAKRFNLPDFATASGQLEAWRKSNGYENSEDNSTYFDGTDDLLLRLTSTENNPVDIEADSRVHDEVAQMVKNLWKDYYPLKYTNEQEFGFSGGEAESAVEESINQAYTTATNGRFRPFNRVVIHDELVDENNEFAMNFDIRIPGGATIENPQAFSFAFVPSAEHREYRCYDAWDPCEYESQDGCVLRNKREGSYVMDGYGKRVATRKDMEFECANRMQRDTCKKWEITTTCDEHNLSMLLADYDDHDFSEAFKKAVGDAQIVNTIPTLFGGKKLECQEGVWISVDWLTDPSWWAMKILHFNAQTAQGGGDTSAGIAALAGGETTNQCAVEWARCMSDHGFGMMNQIRSFANMQGDGGCSVGENLPYSTKAAEETCDLVVQSTAGCSDYCYSCGEEAYKERIAEEQIRLRNDGDTGLFGGLEGDVTHILDTLTPLDLIGFTLLEGALTDTFDHCDQCTNQACALSHDPHSAADLIKMTNGLAEQTHFWGAKYGMCEGDSSCGGKTIHAYGNCVKGRKSCAYKIFGKCQRSRYNFCCYSGKIARVLAAQLYQQLGYSFFDDRPDVCERLKLDSLSNVSFKACTKDAPIPSPSNKCVNYEEIKDYILNQTNWDTEKSINLNTELQGILESIQDMSD